MFTTILCCSVKANATLASRTGSLNNFCSCTVNNSASLIPMKPLYSELVGLMFNMNDHTGWWWLGKTIVSQTNEQQASANSSVRKATYKRKNDRRHIKKWKKEQKVQNHGTQRQHELSQTPTIRPRLFSGFAPTTLRPSSRVFLEYVFFLGLISWRSTSHLSDAHRGNGTQVPVDW